MSERSRPGTDQGPPARAETAGGMADLVAREPTDTEARIFHALALVTVS